MEVAAQEARVAQSFRDEGLSEQMVQDNLLLANPYGDPDAKRRARFRVAVRTALGVVALVAYGFLKRWLRGH